MFSSTISVTTEESSHRPGGVTGIFVSNVETYYLAVALTDVTVANNVF